MHLLSKSFFYATKRFLCFTFWENMYCLVGHFDHKQLFSEVKGSRTAYWANWSSAIPEILKSFLEAGEPYYFTTFLDHFSANVGLLKSAI